MMTGSPRNEGAAVPQPDDDATRCGFVALLGAPNAGKSTLLNQLVGSKVSIVSPKVQTTRARVLGIALEGPAQLVLVDTPGIFQPRRRLERAMVQAAWQGADDADHTVLLVDASRKKVSQDSWNILDRLKRAGRTATLALNKVDACRRDTLLEKTQRFSEAGGIDDVFMISALTGDGVTDLRRALARRMPPGPWHYPEDQLADMPQRLLAAELTREKLFIALHQELPYALAVETESWTGFDDGSVRIDQTVYVERDSQKGIVLGKGGQLIKSVREAAQAELAAMLGTPVHLFVHVKIKEGWADDPARYREMGLDFSA